MLDPTLRPLIDPPLQYMARRLRWHADAVTLGGFVLGLAAAWALAFGHDHVALVLFLFNRLADGLDGALARLNGPTDRGGLLDIVLDFSVYALLAFAFAWRDPSAAALPAAFLLAAFMATASSFLAYAIIAAKRGQATEKRGRKSFYYLGGLTEGTETILFFALCLALPGWFPVLAWIFGAMAWLTALGRVLSGWRDFA